MEADGHGQEMLGEVEMEIPTSWLSEKVGTGHQPHIQVSQKNNATPHTMAKGRELLPLKYILHLTHSFQEFVIAFNQTLLDDGSWLRLHF